ncbi:VOC family protein [Gordonia terrae]
MSVSFNHIIIGAHDPQGSADFYLDVLGARPAHSWVRREHPSRRRHAVAVRVGTGRRSGMARSRPATAGACTSRTHRASCWRCSPGTVRVSYSSTLSAIGIAIRYLLLNSTSASVGPL